MDAIIIGGFLGSGKTTTVINIGKELAERGHTVAIIVNEVGEVGIDGDLISKYGLDTKEITNGCICCTLKLNMKTTLTELYHSYNPDYILVEPSGIAFPNLIKKELELMNFGDNIRVAPLVTLIDGSRFKEIMKSVKVYALRQIEDAEILVINKADLVKPIKMSVLVDSVQQLNSSAKVINMSSRSGDAGFSELMEMIVPYETEGIDVPADHGNEQTVPLWENMDVTEGTGHHERSHEDHHEHHHYGHHTHYDSESSGLASYANDYRILEDDIDRELARQITLEIAESVKGSIMNLSPEFVGHIKMFLEVPDETVKISITSHAESPSMNIIETTAHSGPRFKILTAVSGLNENELVNLVDENVEAAFSKRNMTSQRLHDSHDHDHHHHDDDHEGHHDHHHSHEHKYHHSELEEDMDDIYDHDLTGCGAEGSDCIL
ncbi:GTP-binding protein [Methanolobus bombayensis]|uniref:GTP-binding protein n=1 Tax=Methanolobus bombayensis TaxID=38023 RepID=UPI001AE5C0E2|nr:GTP-binding protein [Methanolobus bombayensis]MBP1908748.1 G3E family GTPase [Methanolobus bombayensis]